MEEMHILAYVYHWSRDEVRKLRITERRKWVERIIDQKEKENKAVEKATAEAKSKAKTGRPPRRH